MEINKLKDHLRFTSNVGYSISDEEFILLELNCNIIKESQNHEKMYFFGKVNGINKDYFIIFGINFKNSKYFCNINYYWSYDDFEFSPLTNPNQDECLDLSSVNSYFKGLHSEKIIINNKLYTELDRLSYFIKNLGENHIIVPKNSFKIIPNEELRQNQNYTGFSDLKLENFVNFKDTSDEFKIRLKAQNKPYLNYFQQLPSQVKELSLVTNTEKNSVFIRSLVFPGMVSYSKLNSSIFGYYYFGNGIKNNDLGFILC